MQRYVLIGTIGSPKGVDGDFIIHTMPRAISKLANKLNVKVGFSESFAKNQVLETISFHDNRKVSGKLMSINSKEDIALFKDQGLFVSIDDILKSNPGFYLIDDILGCQVHYANGTKELGEVIEVWELPANDVWLIDTPDGELPIPVIDDVVLNVDFDKKTIQINLMDGLLDLLNKTKGEDDED